VAKQVSVKTLQGKTWMVDVDTPDTVLGLKQKLQDKEAGPVEAQRLIFGGKILEDPKTLEEYGLLGAVTAPVFLVINPEAAKKWEEAKRASEAKKAAEAQAAAAAAAKANDPKEQEKIANVAKKLSTAKNVNDLVTLMEAELKAIKFKPAVEWACPACTTVNKPTARRCDVCGQANPDPPAAEAAPAAGGGGGAAAAGGGGGGAAAAEPWICGMCTYHNPAASRRCTMCDGARPN